jgi:hypothetical protein
MSTIDCQDCAPVVPSDAAVDIKKQAQPASKAQMAKVPVPNTLPGPSSGPEYTNGTENHDGKGTAEEEIQPPTAVYPNLIIEFCDRCRWYVSPSHRWMVDGTWS